MLTPFGKLCRKLRIDRGELLKDMADKLGVTSAYLSAVEVGKRNIPKSWPAAIRDHYDLSDEEYNELIAAYNLSQKKINMAMDSFEDRDKETALAFARDFGSLNEKDKKKIREILLKGRE